MTQDEIIEMARQAGAWETDTGELVKDDLSLQAFAKLVAAKAFTDGVDAEWIARRTKYAVEQEREACAKLCEDESWRLKKIAIDTNSAATNSMAIQASRDADAIRARGEA